jgi:PAS domain S-box-containing protein
MAAKKDNSEKIFADEKNLRILINNTDDPIWLVDTDCNIVECNNSFKNWVRCFIGHELGKGDNVLFNGKDKNYLDKYEMCYRLALNGRFFRSVEDMKIDGELRYTTVTFNPVFDHNHEVTGVSCFARDITEQRKHLLKIEEQNSALREIAFIESHKVRGPVATILGLEQFFNYDDLSDPGNKEIMQCIAKLTHELDAIIQEVVRKSNEIDQDS